MKATKRVPKKATGPGPTFGERIKRARVAAGMTQSEFARAVAQVSKSKCTKSLVSVWESNKVQNPQNATMLAISAVSGFSQQYLISGKGPEKAPPVSLKVAARNSITRDSLRRALMLCLGMKDSVLRGSPDSLVANVTIEIFETLLDDPDTPDGALKRIALLANK